MTDSLIKGLPVKTMAKVVEDARAEILESFSGDVLPVPTRFARLNRHIQGGLRPKFNYYICGASGHGKSYFLNLLHEDILLAAQIQGRKKYVLHFAFDTSATEEIIRSVGRLARVSYDRLMSTQRDSLMTELEYENIMMMMDQIKEKNIFMVDTPGNSGQVLQTVQKFRERFPDGDLYVTLDHLLLLQPGAGDKDEVETIAKFAKTAIEIRKTYGATGIYLGQLNDKIESERRRDPAASALHYPTKTDIHGSKQIYHAMDAVLVVHQPELLNLEYYGRKKIPTRDLIALHILKNRRGKTGLILLKNNLELGTIEEYDSTTNSPIGS
jgi:replicative DNA helicase